MTARGAVSVVYREPGAMPGALVGVMVLHDTDLRVVGQYVLRSAEPVTVELPWGHYLARAVLPSGDDIRVPLTVERAPHKSTVELPYRPRTAHAPDDGWLLAWQRHGAGWAPTPDLDLSPGSGPVFDAVLAGDPDSASIALQTGFGASAHLAVVPPEVALRVTWADHGNGSWWSVSPAPGGEATLLAYLHRGDLAAACVVATDVLASAASPGDTGSQLLDLLIGYHLLQTGDERLHTWAPALVWQQPLSVDAAILSAWEQLRRDAPVAGAVRGELLRAEGTGLPVVAAGLRLLTSGLTLFDADAYAAAALGRLRGYLLAGQPAGLTTFRGPRPDAPGEVVTGRPISAAVRRIDGGVGAGDARPSPGSVPTETVDVTGVVEALARLPEDALGYTVASRRLPVGHGWIDATVTLASGRTDAFDVRMRLDLADPLRRALAGTTAVLRVDAVVHYLATFDVAGTALFTGVPPGAWRLTVWPRRAASREVGTVYTMPPVRREEALLAAPDGAARVLVRAVTPGGGVEYVLWVAPGQPHALEVVARGGAEARIVAVDYETAHAATRVLIPLATVPGHVASGLARLDGFATNRPWAVSEPVEAFGPDWSTSDITSSVRAADSGTQATWRRIAGMADPLYRQAIEDGLRDEW